MTKASDWTVGKKIAQRTANEQSAHGPECADSKVKSKIIKRKKKITHWTKIDGLYQMIIKI